jgi:hypothetical protein
MTSTQDVFVGVAAIIFGCLLALGALVNASSLMRLAKPRILADNFGQAPARWIIAGIGAALIAMGLLIAAGWRIRW